VSGGIAGIALIVLSAGLLVGMLMSGVVILGRLGGIFVVWGMLIEMTA
jgi:hypothetical protein